MENFLFYLLLYKYWIILGEKLFVVEVFKFILFFRDILMLFFVIILWKFKWFMMGEVLICFLFCISWFFIVIFVFIILSRIIKGLKVSSFVYVINICFK